MSITNHKEDSDYRNNMTDFPDTYNLEDELSDTERSDTGVNSGMEEYSLPEDDKFNGQNIDQVEDEEEENEAWHGDLKKGAPSPFGLMFKIMSNPIEGWKSLKRSNFPVEKISVSLFYPLIIAAGLSNLSSLFYDAGTEAGEMVISILFTSITFFFGYYTAIMAGGMLLCKETKEVLRTDFGKEFIMYSVSTTALFYILFRLLPMAAPIIAFFPIWTVYIMDKGMKFLKVPKDKNSQTLVLLSILVIGSLLLWDWLLSFMIPE